MTVEYHELSNGFRVVTEKMPGLQSASIGIWITAGGRTETQSQNGIAHFLEHMAFKGTKTRSALSIAEAIEDVGGHINAYTSREMTAYYARVLAGDVPLAFDVISDILLNPTFEEKDIENERGVILQEIGQALDTPDDVIFDWLQEEAYPDQPIGRPILGPAERVSSFTREQLLEFVGRHYGPDRMILSAAGAIDHGDIVRRTEAAFGSLKAGVPAASQLALYRGGERQTVKDLEQAHFALAFESANYTSPEIYSAQVFANALGGGMSSRLFQELRENRGLCYTIFAQAGAYSDTGLTTIYAGTSADQVDLLAIKTIEEIKRAAGGMSDHEIARAKSQMKAGLLMGLENPASRAERLARMISIWGRVPDLAEIVGKIDAVTVAGVRDYAQNMVAGPSPTLALYGPVAKAPRLHELESRLAA